MDDALSKSNNAERIGKTVGVFTTLHKVKLCDNGKCAKKDLAQVDYTQSETSLYPFQLRSRLGPNKF